MNNDRNSKRKSIVSEVQMSQQNPTFSYWEVGNRYYIEKVLGKGSYGQVSLAHDRLTMLSDLNRLQQLLIHLVFELLCIQNN